MPIKEKSFRIGCGRYLQEARILQSLGEEVLRLGRFPLIVGGKTALEITRERIENSVKDTCEKYFIEVHRGTCNHERAKELAEFANAEGYDVIVGVGGGVIMDFSKLIGFYAELPVINVPTSSATCAAYTPLSVCYSPEGKTVGSRHYEREVDAVLADTEILVNQPPRLLLAGMFDAIAKFIEIKHRFAEENTDCPLGLDWAYAMSQYSYAELCKKTEPCLYNMEKGEITDTVEHVIFTSVAATGVISGIARGSNQTALAHKFYEITRVLYYEDSRPYLHGEIVGVGLLLQNAFNGEPENNGDLIALMKKYGMPSCLTDIGLKATPETFEAYYDKLVNTSAISESGEGGEQRLRTAMEYLWRLG